MCIFVFVCFFLIHSINNNCIPINCECCRRTFRNVHLQFDAALRPGHLRRLRQLPVPLLPVFQRSANSNNLSRTNGSVRRLLLFARVLVRRLFPHPFEPHILSPIAILIALSTFLPIFFFFFFFLLKEGVLFFK